MKTGGNGSVSILVFLEALLQHAKSRGSESLNKVSILVFLEALLQHPSAEVRLNPLSSFNPCFPGSSTSTGHCNSKNRLWHCFNPCFPGSSTSTLWRTYETVQLVRFQSLFSWKLYFNNIIDIAWL